MSGPTDPFIPFVPGAANPNVPGSLTHTLLNFNFGTKVSSVDVGFSIAPLDPTTQFLPLENVPPLTSTNLTDFGTAAAAAAPVQSVAGLDGTITVSQLAAALPAAQTGTPKGFYNVATNTPTLSTGGGGGVVGDVYTVGPTSSDNGTMSIDAVGALVVGNRIQCINISSGVNKWAALATTSSTGSFTDLAASGTLTAPVLAGQSLGISPPATVTAPPTTGAQVSVAAGVLIPGYPSISPVDMLIDASNRLLQVTGADGSLYVATNTGLIKVANHSDLVDTNSTAAIVPGFGAVADVTITPAGQAVALTTLAGVAYVGSPSGLVPAVPSGQPTAYLGNIATRCQIHGTQGSPSTQAQMMARTSHFARASAVSPQLVLGGFFVTSSATGESALGAVTAVTASIEYPLGVITRVTFGGSNNGSIPDGGMLVSDAVAGLTIPTGAQFWVRVWYSNTAGVAFSQYTTSHILAAYDVVATGATTTDLTGGGTVTSGTSINCAYPNAIIAQTTSPSAFLFGDSRCFGTADIPNDRSGDSGELARSIGPSFPYINASRFGDTLTHTLGNMTNRIALSRYCSFGVNEYGVNDLKIAGMSAGALAALRNQANAALGVIMYGTTLVPETTSTDNWATTGNQTVISTNGFETNRKGFNAQALAGLTTELDCFDTAGAIDPTNSGLWPVTGAAFGYTVDGTHENTAGSLLIKKSSLYSQHSFSRY